MGSDGDREAEVIGAHQEMIARIEEVGGRMRALSLATLVVAAALAVSYVSQLALPFAGVTTVTVDLTDPSNVAAELVVLALALAWLYVGAEDLRFSWRVKSQIRRARSKEREIQDKLGEPPRP